MSMTHGCTLVAILMVVVASRSVGAAEPAPADDGIDYDDVEVLLRSDSSDDVRRGLSLLSGADAGAMPESTRLLVLKAAGSNNRRVAIAGHWTIWRLAHVRFLEAYRQALESDDVQIQFFGASALLRITTSTAEAKSRSIEHLVELVTVRPSFVGATTKLEFDLALAAAQELEKLALALSLLPPRLPDATKLLNEGSTSEEVDRAFARYQKEMGDWWNKHRRAEVVDKLPSLKDHAWWKPASEACCGG